jgi:acetyl-CoA acetyltransferase
MNRGSSAEDVVIVAAKRTPIGAINGMFRGVPASTLGEAVIRALLSKPACGGMRFPKSSSGRS